MKGAVLAFLLPVRLAILLAPLLIPFLPDETHQILDQLLANDLLEQCLPALHALDIVVGLLAVLRARELLLLFAVRLAYSVISGRKPARESVFLQKGPVLPYLEENGAQTSHVGFIIRSTNRTGCGLGSLSAGDKFWFVESCHSLECPLWCRCSNARRHLCFSIVTQEEEEPSARPLVRLSHRCRRTSH